MKKIALLIIIVCMLFALTLSACGNTQDSQTVSLYVPDGAPALSVATLLADSHVGDATVDVSIVNATEISAKVISETADMAILPTNMASILYNNGEPYQLVSINTFGLLYIVSGQAEATIDDLVGEVVCCIGKGSVPQYVLEKVLSSIGIEYAHSATPIAGKVALNYFSSGADIIPQLASGKVKFALLGEPAASKSISVATNMGKQLHIAIDLQQQWSDITGAYGYTQAGLFVKTQFIENNAELVASVCDRLATNGEYLLDNIDDIAQLLADNNSSDLSGVVFTSDILDRCNVDFRYASDVAGDIFAFLSVMYDVNASSVGGKLPDDNFIYRMDR